MDRIWQWAWDRYGARYSWAVFALCFPLALPVHLFWLLLIVAVEGSSDFVKAAAVGIVTVPVMFFVVALPGLGRSRLVEQWAAGGEVDRARALDNTYSWTRESVVRTVVSHAVWAGTSSAVVSAIAGSTGWRPVQFGILGIVTGTAVGLTAAHSFADTAIRPARVAIAGGTAIGDGLPRSRPSFAAWSNTFVLAALFVFAVIGAMLALVFDRAREEPLILILIGGH
jgi:adenylate cyclase